MNRIKHFYTVALIQVMFVSAGCFGIADGQDQNSIVKAIPEASARVSSRLSYQDLSQDDREKIRQLPELNQPVRPSGQTPDINGDRSEQELLDDVLQMENVEGNRSRKRQEFGPWPRKGIRAINVDIREPNDNSPQDRSGQLLESSNANWSDFEFNATPKVFAWAAPDIRYQPLYFEDVALERYGQTPGPHRQFVLSTFNFWNSVIFLPNQMRNDPPSSCDYPLGFCRPGNPVPFTYQRNYLGQPNR